MVSVVSCTCKRNMALYLGYSWIGCITQKTRELTAVSSLGTTLARLADPPVAPRKGHSFASAPSPVSFTEIPS